jgi:hypothetical protein
MCKKCLFSGNKKGMKLNMTEKVEENHGKKKWLKNGK